jgi:hypothetical protein
MWMKICVMADTEKDDLLPLSRQRTMQLSLAFAVFLWARQNFVKDFLRFDCSSWMWEEFLRSSLSAAVENNNQEEEEEE